MALYFMFLSLLLIILLFASLRKSERNNLPPGPKKLPIIGNLHHLSELPYRSLWSLSQKYGSLMYLHLGSIPTLVVSSPTMAREMLKVNDLNCFSRPLLTGPYKFLYRYSDVVFAPYGDYWRQMKKLCILELFSSKRVRSFSRIREEEVASMMKLISDSSPSRGVNLSKIFVSLSCNIICRIALGRRCIEEGCGESKFYRMFKEEEALIMSFFFSDYFPALGFLDRITGKISKLDKNFAEFDSFYEEVIEEHLHPERVEPEQEDLVDLLLKLRREANLTMDHIKGIVADMFLAGTESPAAILSWAMTELMRNPGAMRRAQDEVRASIGAKGKVEEEDLHQLKYLKCIVKETMRLYTPLPLLLPREASRQMKIGGYDVPPKTRVIVNAWAIGRDPNSWENPEEFLPDRFMDTSIDLKGNDFEFIPFGAGRRICPAVNFGMAMIEIALANLLYSFDWKLPDGMSKEGIDRTESPTVVLNKKYDLYLVGIRCM